MQDAGLNVRGLVPGAIVDWIGKELTGREWAVKEKNGFERTG